jgi:hypothetical protein
MPETLELGPMAQVLADHPMAPPQPKPEPIPPLAELLAEVEAVRPEDGPDLAPLPEKRDGRAGRKVTAHAPIYAPPLGPGGRRRAYMTRGFSSNWGAKQSAENYLPRMGVPTPKLDRDYRIYQLADGWAWDRILPPTPPDPKETTTMPTDNVTPIRTPSAPMTNDNDGPRASTLAQRREIRDYLDAHYDEDHQRWRGELNDKQAAEDLSMPRVWVTQVREATYGPDENEAMAKEREADGQILKQLSDLEGIISEVQKDLVTLRSRVQARVRL